MRLRTHLAVGLIAIAALVSCRKEQTQASRTAPAPSKRATATASDDWEELPSGNAYAGSASCRECHEKNFLHWQHDWHSRALAPASAKSVVGSFASAHFKGTSSEAWMTRSGDSFVMSTRDARGELGDYPVAWVIGGKRMQDALTIFPDGRWQVLPVYFHVTGGGSWVDYNEHKQGVVSPTHPFFWTNFRRTANKECLECHSTGLDLRYDATAQSWSTTFVDAGVACEACHGPGARHAETKSKADIIHPGHIDAALALSICARCHGPHEPLFPLLDQKDQFRPGQRYDDRYQALVIVDSTARSGEYFADGRPNSSSFEYQALVQSRCYRVGGATCLTCHTAPHKEHGPNEMKGDADRSCRDCHAAIAKEGRAHTHHPAKAASCTGCHMPRLVSGVLDKFPDHSIDIPNARNTLRHGVPNACGVCHAKKPAELIEQTIASWWPQAAERQQRRSVLADAIDEASAAQSLPSLTAVVRDLHEAPTLRGATAILLGQRFPTAAASILEPLLADRDPLVRARMIEALGYARASTAADAIARYGTDPSLHVRQAAGLVLAAFGDARGFKVLQALAADPASRALVKPHIMLGIAAANRGDFITARSELELALVEAPYITDALVFLADIHARQDDLPGARTLLEDALRYDPQHAGAIKRLRALGAR